MIMATKKQINEARIRMKQMKSMYSMDTIEPEKLTEKNAPCIYITQTLVGIVSEINKMKEVRVIRREFESKYGFFVYLVLARTTESGTILTMLYVYGDDNEQEWEDERLSSDNVPAYSYNVDRGSGEFRLVYLKA